jgi:hypothetical protein
MKSSSFFAAAVVVALSVSAPAQAPPKLVPLSESGVITYYIADGIPSFGSRIGDDELATWAFQEWERAAGGTIRLERIAEESEAMIRLYWLSWAPAKYGEMKPQVASRPQSALVFVRPDTHAKHKTLGSAAAKDRLLRDTIVYLTTLHEIGHAFGLGHTDAEEDVMRTEGAADNFRRYRQRLKTRADIAKVEWLSDADTARIRRLYQR